MDRGKDADANRVAAIRTAHGESRQRIFLRSGAKTAQCFALHRREIAQRFEQPLERAAAVFHFQLRFKSTHVARQYPEKYFRAQFKMRKGS